MKFLEIDLEAMGVSVRSFGTVTKLRALSAEMTMDVEVDTSRFGDRNESQAAIAVSAKAG